MSFLISFFQSEIAVLFTVLPIVVFIIVAVVFIAVGVSKNAAQNNNTAVERKNVVRSSEVSQQTKEEAKTAKPDPEKTHAHVGDAVVGADGHVHFGGYDEEKYEPIEGSLGDVSDEGCSDLNGVRLIAHDLAYEKTDEKRDYADVAKAMVLGEILNQPRFKKPYRRK